MKTLPKYITERLKITKDTEFDKAFDVSSMYDILYKNSDVTCVITYGRNNWIISVRSLFDIIIKNYKLKQYSTLHIGDIMNVYSSYKFPLEFGKNTRDKLYKCITAPYPSSFLSLNEYKNVINMMNCLTKMTTITLSKKENIHLGIYYKEKEFYLATFYTTKDDTNEFINNVNGILGIILIT